MRIADCRAFKWVKTGIPDADPVEIAFGVELLFPVATLRPSTS